MTARIIKIVSKKQGRRIQIAIVCGCEGETLVDCGRLWPPVVE